MKATSLRKLHNAVAVVVLGAALFTAGVALAGNPNHPNNGQDSTTGTTTGTTTTVATSTSTVTTSTSGLPSTAKGYGFYCQWASKKHIAGQKGTPFSQCVLAMAKAAHGASDKAACANLSHTHVVGQKGNAYSLCVSAAWKLHKDEPHGKSGQSHGNH